MRAFRLSAAALCLSAAFLSFPSAYAAEPAGQEVISASGSYLQSIQWDAEYDVVIAGYGFAGAAAAIAAADAGASVLMVEKAPYGKEGGMPHVEDAGLSQDDVERKGQQAYRPMLTHTSVQ